VKRWANATKRMHAFPASMTHEPHVRARSALRFRVFHTKPLCQNTFPST
jgi:hypothetical protein